jgi:hypothetical protein
MKHVVWFERYNESLHLRTIGFGLRDKIKSLCKFDHIRVVGFDQAYGFDNPLVAIITTSSFAVGLRKMLPPLLLMFCSDLRFSFLVRMDHVAHHAEIQPSEDGYLWTRVRCLDSSVVASDGHFLLQSLGNSLPFRIDSHLFLLYFRICHCLEQEEIIG